MTVKLSRGNHKMKQYVLVVSPEFGQGGIGNHTLKLVTFLLKEGFRVKVHTHASEKLIHLTQPNLEIIPISSPLLGFGLFNPFFDLLSSVRLKFREKPSLIIRTLPPFYLRLPFFRNSEIPEISVSHGVRHNSLKIFKDNEKMDIKHKYLFSFLGQLFLDSTEKSVMSNSKTVIAVSEYTKRQIIEQHRIKPENVMVLHNFVDVNTFRRKKIEEINSDIGKKIIEYKKNSRLVVFVGRPTPAKNFGLLYNIIKDLRDKSDIKFAIVGMKKTDDCVKKYAALLNSSNVLFLGNVDNSFLPDVYSVSDFLIITSLDENLPTVLLEGMACGVIPLATKVGGIPEVIEDGKTGFLFNHNKNDFLKVINYLLSSDNQTLDVLSRNSEKIVRDRFSTSFFQKNFINLVNETIES